MKLNKKQIKNIVKSYDIEKIMDLEEDARNDEINDIILECLNYEHLEPFTSEWDTLYSQYEDIIYPMMDKELTRRKIKQLRYQIALTNKQEKAIKLYQEILKLKGVRPQ